MTRASANQADTLHALVAEALIEQIQAWKAGRLVDIGKDGEYVRVFPPALLAQAIKFLKDNGVDAPAVPEGRVDRLAKALPDVSELDNVVGFPGR